MSVKRILRAYVAQSVFEIKRHIDKFVDNLIQGIGWWMYSPTGWVKHTPTLEEQIAINGATDEKLDEVRRCECCGMDIK